MRQTHRKTGYICGSQGTAEARSGRGASVRCSSVAFHRSLKLSSRTQWSQCATSSPAERAGITRKWTLDYTSGRSGSWYVSKSPPLPPPSPSSARRRPRAMPSSLRREYPRPPLRPAIELIARSMRARRSRRASGVSRQSAAAAPPIARILTVGRATSTASSDTPAFSATMCALSRTTGRSVSAAKSAMSSTASSLDTLPWRARSTMSRSVGGGGCGAGGGDGGGGRAQSTTEPARQIPCHSQSCAVPSPDDTKKFPQLRASWATWAHV